ncbi:MAG: acetate--CoA ligase family protein [Bacillota bacterium]|nr:acetate--CoA ligase family protein [Bacillota bacterium]
MPLLTEPEAAELLASHGVPVAPWRLARDGEEAVRYADEMGYPVVVKAVRRGLAHKSDAGAVRLDLRDAAAVRTAVAAIGESIWPGRVRMPVPGEGFLVQAMIRGGLEMIVGGQRDPQFGPVVMVGLGGIFAEVFQDVTFLLVPCRDEDVLGALSGLRCARLLGGVRGQPPRDVSALASVVQAVGRVLEERPEVVSVDINPLAVLARGQGCVALDALVEIR